MLLCIFLSKAVSLFWPPQSSCCFFRGRRLFKHKPIRWTKQNYLHKAHNGILKGKKKRISVMWKGQSRTQVFRLPQAAAPPTPRERGAGPRVPRARSCLASYPWLGAPRPLAPVSPLRPTPQLRTPIKAPPSRPFSVLAARRWVCLLLLCSNTQNTLKISRMTVP